MKVSFNFDTGARRIRFLIEDPLEEAVLKEMSLLCEKGVNMKIRDLTEEIGEYEIEMRISGFSEGREKKSE